MGHRDSDNGNVPFRDQKHPFHICGRVNIKQTFCRHRVVPRVTIRCLASTVAIGVGDPGTNKFFPTNLFHDPSDFENDEM